MSALLLVALLGVAPSGFAQEAPVLTSDPPAASDDGIVRLDWNAVSPGLTYDVEQAQSQTFSDAEQIYQGPDLAIFLSGLKNGTYYFRVRVKDGSWSDVKRITVQHHSLRLAFVLFGIGALVFLLTVWVVIRGAYQTNAI